MIGGGLAGLSSAVALAEAGFRVRLLERRPFLGGRAASYDLPGGEHVDNCQHVTLGCCTNLADFYTRAGAADKIHFYDRLYFAAPDGRRGSMQAALLPAPLHMALSFAVFPLLGWADKRAIAGALLAIARSGGRPADAASAGAGISMLAWLHKRRQTDRAIRRFWEVILVSALDEELDRIDAQYGIDVFWKAFLSTRRGYRIGIPRVPLGNLYDGCKEAITKRGGEVILRAGVRGLLVANGVGVVDPDYSGPNDEIMIQVLNFTDAPVDVTRGDRLAQGIVLPAPRVTWSEVAAIREVTRGGFGATGN